MKKTIVLTLMAFMFTKVMAQPSVPTLDSLMDFYSNEYGFNGVALISYKGHILLEKGYGYKDVEKKIKNDKHTIFQIGSNTKQFTAEIILMLAKEKKLTVHDKLSKYFPKYSSGDKITLENLLTHTSGIYNYTEDTAWQRDPMHPMTKKEIMALFENKPLEFTPGEKFEYSNSNYILLGYIIEKVTGEKYEQVVREKILEPLGMTHSGFDFIHLKDKNKALGYYTIHADNYDQAPVSDSTFTFAAGGLYADAADLLKWHNAVWSYKLLPREWQEKSFKPFRSKYAYGWFVDSMYGKKLIGHSGGVPGFYTYEMNVPQDDVCILLLQNCEQPDMDNNTISNKILDCMYDKNFMMPAPAKEVTLNDDVLSQYAGTYDVTPDFSLTITVKDHQLWAQATGQDVLPMKAESDTGFFNKDFGIKLEFKKENGKVDQLVILQSGQKIPAKKR